MNTSYALSGNFDVNFRQEPTITREEGLVELVYTILPVKIPAEVSDPVISWTGSIPCVDLSYIWRPDCHCERVLRADWAAPASTMASIGAPVISLFSEDGENRMTFAASEVCEPLKMHAGCREEDATVSMYIKFQTANWDWSIPHTLRILLDSRPIPYYKALENVSRWWETDCGMTPAPTPEAARIPFYSTWYSCHQNVYQEELEAEFRRAADLGMESVIVDDGWQTMDNHRGYAYCGDWEMAPGRFPDFAEHVKRVHKMGLKYLVWYSVPFVGIHSKAWERFKDKMLTYTAVLQTGVLDPRYPEVREYLIGHYEHAIRDWDLDGLKLDFIDRFECYPDTPGFKDGMDTPSVLEGTRRLLLEIGERLRAIKPDVMIEFRQRYIGPLMRCCGNMFRVGDCPQSGMTNRVGIADIKMLSGDSAVHSDPIMFHAEEDAAVTALQIIDSLFSTIQISVPLDKISAEQAEMLRFWIGFLKENVSILQKGDMIYHDPQLLYPLMETSEGGRSILVKYAPDRIVPLPAKADEAIVINAVKEDSVVLRLEKAATYAITAQDCCGRVLWSETKALEKGLVSFPAVTAGLLTLKKVL